jgi:hypothetical protein
MKDEPILHVIMNIVSMNMRIGLIVMTLPLSNVITPIKLAVHITFIGELSLTALIARLFAYSIISWSMEYDMSNINSNTSG